MPISTRYRDLEIAHVLETSRAKGVVFIRQFLKADFQQIIEMLGVAGQHPLVRDASNRGFGAAHIASQCRGRPQLSRWLHSTWIGGTCTHRLLSGGKIVMMIVVMVVMRFWCRAP